MQLFLVLAVFALIVLAFAGANLYNGIRLEKARKVEQERLLPPGISLQEFAKTAPFQYQKVSEGYKVWQKEKSIEEFAHLAATEEEAMQYILFATTELERKNAAGLDISG